MTSTSDTLALLIDGDNASPKIVSGLLAEIATYGAASVKRILGTGPSRTSTARKSACWSIPSNRSSNLPTRRERMPRMAQ